MFSTHTFRLFVKRTNLTTSPARSLYYLSLGGDSWKRGSLRPTIIWRLFFFYFVDILSLQSCRSLNWLRHDPAHSNKLGCFRADSDTDTLEQCEPRRTTGGGRTRVGKRKIQQKFITTIDAARENDDTSIRPSKSVMVTARLAYTPYKCNECERIDVEKIVNFPRRRSVKIGPKGRVWWGGGNNSHQSTHKTRSRFKTIAVNVF